MANECCLQRGNYVDRRAAAESFVALSDKSAATNVAVQVQAIHFPQTIVTAHPNIRGHSCCS